MFVGWCPICKDRVSDVKCNRCGFEITFEHREDLEIQPEEAKQLIESKKAIIIDVRDNDEFATTHVNNSLHIGLDELHKQLEEIQKNKTILTVCHHGNRSMVAASFLSQKGLNVRSIAGGLEAYHEIDKGIKLYERYFDGHKFVITVID